MKMECKPLEGTRLVQKRSFQLDFFLRRRDVLLARQAMSEKTCGFVTFSQYVKRVLSFPYKHRYLEFTAYMK